MTARWRARSSDMVFSVLCPGAWAEVTSRHGFWRYPYTVYMLPSLDEVLAMEVCRRGRPAVIAGNDRLDTPVRWVHAIELTDVARLLRGGELVLSTGIALPDDDRLLTAYVTELADVGVAGLAVEL